MTTTRLGFAAAAAVLTAAIALAPAPAEARMSNGAAVAVGLGSFALGAAIGSANARPAHGYYAPPQQYAQPAPQAYCRWPDGSLTVGACNQQPQTIMVAPQPRYAQPAHQQPRPQMRDWEGPGGYPVAVWRPVTYGNQQPVNRGW